MKKYLLAVLLLASFQSFGQFLNYTNINGRYKWIAGKFDSTFTIPSGTTPSLRVGGGTGPGALFYRTTDSTVYQYTGTQWIKLRAGVSPTDTAGIWISNVYRQTGTDSVFYVKGGTSTFAFRDSIGNVGGGGGGGKIYYFNGGVNLGTFAGLTMYELGDTAVTSAAANFTRSTTGNLANFITDVNRPGLLQIPAGVWTVDAYLSETGGGSNHAQIWIEVEKWDGTSITTIATSPIEEITNGNVIDLYTWGVSIPTTTLAVTDRIIIQFYITNTNGKTVTLYTQNGYIGEVHTTFTTGIGSLNGLTAPTQYFATGTSGTDFAISSSTATHTFNLPTASGSNRGALSSADWTTFNGKVGGSGTTNYVPKWTGSTALGNSQIFDNGTQIGIGTISPLTSAFAQFQKDQNSITQVVVRNDNSGTNAQSGFAAYNSAFNNTGVVILAKYGTGFSGYKIISANDGGIYNSQGDIFFLNDNPSGRIKFNTGNNSNVQMVVFPTGNVGIAVGTTDAGYRLDVSGTFRSTLDANINGATFGTRSTNGIAIGQSALNAVTGDWNVAIGYRAARLTTTGTYNIALGSNALENNTTGGYSIAIGPSALQNMTSYGNIAIGADAGKTITTGALNLIFGGNPGFTTGSQNISIGSSTTGITTGSYNVLIGQGITGLSSSLSNTIILADGQGNQRLYINNSGNAAIGTSTIISKTGRWLQITATSNVESSLVLNRTGGVSDARWDLYIPASSNALRLYNSNAGDIATFTNSGRLLLGTTTESTFLLDVNGTVRTSSFFQFAAGTRGILATDSYLSIFQTNASLSTIVANSVRSTASSSEVQKSTADPASYLRLNYQDGITFHTNLTGAVSTAYAETTNERMRITLGGSVGIGTTSPNASALLDVSSTTKGFLPPRMTNAQMVAIATPAAGLVVYDTTNNKLNVYDGTNWVAVH
jgi:hypothetical protein